MLATLPNTSPSYDITSGLALAEKDVAHFPGDGMFRTTLGIVQFRAGLWPEAIATLTQANDLDDNRRFAPAGSIWQWPTGRRAKEEGPRLVRPVGRLDGQAPAGSPGTAPRPLRRRR